MRKGTGIRGKLAAMAHKAREPAIPVVEILSKRANQHHLGFVPWVASPLFVARHNTERRPRLSAARSSAARHDVCAADAETQEILGKLYSAGRPANVFRRGYLAREAAPELVKYTFRRLLERCSGTLLVTQPNGGDQPAMQLLKRPPDLAFRGDRRKFEIGAHTRSYMVRKIGWQRLFRISPRPCFSDKCIVDQSIDLLERLQTLALQAGGHFYNPPLDQLFGSDPTRALTAGIIRKTIVRNKELTWAWST